MMMTALKYPALKTFSMARSGLYFAESLPLTILSSLLLRRGEFTDREKLRNLWSAIHQLHSDDIDHMARGIYPPSVLSPAGPARHMRSLVRLWRDATDVAWRMRHRRHRDLPADEMIDELPEYYRRNFHFQTDGYLSKKSAELYDHQVDVLFSGTAGAMRRLTIPPLRSHLKTLERAQILELGCVPGSLTIDLAK